MDLLCLLQLFECGYSLLGEALPQYDVGCVHIANVDFQIATAETLDLIKLRKRHMLPGSDEFENFFNYRGHGSPPLK
jgi:hypothetical protein